MDSVKVEIAGLLQRVNFSPLQARTYEVLFEEGELTLGQLSQKVGLDPALLKGQIDKMIKKGLLVSKGSEPIVYLAANSDEVLANIKASFTDNWKELKSVINQSPRIDRRRESAGVSLEGRSWVMKKAKEIIKQAQSNICLVAWPKELRSLRRYLEKSCVDKVELRAVLYGDPDFDLGMSLKCTPDDWLTRHGGHSFLATVDNRLAVVANFSPEGKGNGLFTDYRPMVNLYTGFIIQKLHQVSLENTLNQFGVAVMDSGRSFEGILP